MAWTDQTRGTHLSPGSLSALQRPLVHSARHRRTPRDAPAVRALRQPHDGQGQVPPAQPRARRPGRVGRLGGVRGHTRDDVRLQTLSAKACEQRAVDGEKARKQDKDEKECRELARDAYVLLGQGPPDDQKYITMFQVSYEKCMEVRGRKRW